MSEEIFLSALRRAAMMSQQGSKLRSAFQRKILLAEEAGQTPPEMPPQLLAPSLEKLAKTIFAQGVEKIVEDEAALQEEDAKLMIKKAEAEKLAAEQILSAVADRRK